MAASPDYYRLKADEMRALARSIRDSSVRASFFELAEEYEHLAREAARGVRPAAARAWNGDLIYRAR